MRDLAVLLLHLLATVARLAGPGGARSVVAESVLVKHQLLILNRSRKRSPQLRPADRVVAGLCAIFMCPGRMIRSAIVFKPATLLNFHRALIQQKYRRLFSAKPPIKPGPKGPRQDVIAAVVDMKQRNPSWGCPRIAHQITLAFGIPINRDMVRRILAVRYEPKPGSAGPSWLTVLRHAKDAAHRWLWRAPRRRGRRGALPDVQSRTRWQLPPNYISSDHDPLYRFHQWQANLRILDVKAIKTVPYAPLSHPFVERLIGTIRRECLDQTVFWTSADLEGKLLDFQQYFNGHRAHAGLGGLTPEPRRGDDCARASVNGYRWRSHCRGLYHTRIAA